MYYTLGYSSAMHPCRLLDTGSINKRGLWWDDGEPFAHPPTEPVIAALTPFEANHPCMSPRLPPFYTVKAPLFREDFIAALIAAGASNMHLYPAEITDPDNGEIYTHYKAVNIIGLVNAADMKRSIATIHDGIAQIDVNFDHLEIAPDRTENLLMFRLAENNGPIIIHETVRDHLVAHGFNDINFYHTSEVAI
ncbi:MAG: hypothetical protein H6999_08615 [Hahellaceae bacterium]|nr:hypothetical protein [Hahellaceae bacterium]MCP5169808.1 hypothetical protein [Hahellaceae bacterium]